MSPSRPGRLVRRGIEFDVVRNGRAVLLAVVVQVVSLAVARESLGLDFVVSGFDSTGATFRAMVTSAHTDGIYIPTLSFTDLAGNYAAAATFAETPLIEVKTSTPSLIGPGWR